MSAPEYPSPLEVGQTATVCGTLCVTNDVGGTCILQGFEDGIEVVVTKAFWDYETGWRFHGRAEGEVVDRIRAQATTGFTPDHYRSRYPNNPALAEEAEKAARDFDPSRIYFSEHDLRPQPGFGGPR